MAYIHFMNKSDVETIRDEILAAALENVAFEGWSWESVVSAAEEAGHNEHTVRAVFPDRLMGVLDGFADWADREMMGALGGVDPSQMRVRDRVRAALLARFEVLNPHKEAVRQSLQFWIVPTRKPRALKITWRSADRIWDWAGDTATDYNRYTKRGLLSGIIGASTLVWLNDSSEDMSATTRFVDDRIENVMQLGKIVSRFKKG